MSTTDSTTATARAARVVTVTGDLAPDALGAVMPHEHLLSDFSDGTEPQEPLTMELLGEVSLGLPNRDNLLLGDEALAVREATAFKQAGGGTLVDVTTPDLGRDPAALRRIAEATGLAVVMGAGRYRPTGSGDVDGLTEEIVRDITEGVDGVRAGVIGELGALDPGEPAGRAILAAAARASAATGAAITLDRSADPATQRRVLDLLAEEGADLTRVVVGHCDPLSPHPDELEPLLERGVFVQFDQLGRLPSVLSVSDDQDVATAVVELARRGHAERVLLSQDVSAKSHLLAYGGGGYGFILQQLVHYLRMVGADDALIETVTVRNPRRLLTITTPKADS
ncbi:phosphotriesterase [Streptosporangium sp. NPDC020072]|uniref:phosphotriesterase family protein n=1 Tax=Streptosporangium sp. NPDC020072 TaxID=3154788 RepID=UPI0034145769